MAGQHLGPVAQAKVQQHISASMATEFDPAVGGQKQCAVVFYTDPEAVPTVSIAFDEENGARWTRTDDGQLARVP
ncbi:hypothetical protein O4328_41270 [Rhodococcus opacus]|uniref:Uncharacterized protein n=1 Tax=Rhodococcus opacus TaxID=37919 RepID=A0ABT4NU83_RHOOP|nr:hypothetical protein [Rhodococcus opacus]MCZ4589992.1 hypothetical protein [Rhodococcus opacus]